MRSKYNTIKKIGSVIKKAKRTRMSGTLYICRDININTSLINNDMELLFVIYL